MVLEETTSLNGADDVSKTPRLPRWTRQEILVLIQGKRVAENRVRRGRVAVGSGQVEPKWASVSSYCKRHGVNRGAVQCRKRWSNLAGDFKKIKEWELRGGGETESYWVMRNDLRRERKLPGFFDREVYDILDAPSASVTVGQGLDLALATVSGDVAAEEETVVFDSGRSGAAEDGLFSDFEQDENNNNNNNENPTPIAIPIPINNIMEEEATPISDKFQHTPTPPPVSQSQGATNEKQAPSNPEMGSASHEARKRKRVTTTADGDEDNTSLQNQLIEVLEKNGKMLTAQLEAQNNNFQLDREQRKDHADSLVGVLDKLANALAKIADKL